MGPVEIVMIGFPGSQFNGEILPALEAQISQNVISLIDGMLITKADDGSVLFVEFEDPDSSPEVAALAALVRNPIDLVSAEDVDEFAAAIEPGSSAVILAFEHTWAEAFQDAVIDSGGVLLSNFRVPAVVVDEVLDALAALD